MPRRKHIVKSFEEELNELPAEIVAMGGLAEPQVGDAVDALVKRDRGSPRQVVETTTQVDDLRSEIDEQAIRLIAAAPADGRRPAQIAWR